MRNRNTKTFTVPISLIIASITILLTLCFTEAVLAKDDAEERVELYPPPNMVVQSVGEVESKLLKDSLFADSENLNDLRKGYLENNDYLQHPPQTRLYEIIIDHLGAIFGKDEYPRARIHQALLDRVGPNVMVIVTRAVLAMDLYSVMTPNRGEHLFRHSDKSTKFYPLKKDVLAVLELLQIPLIHSVEGITEFSLVFSPIAATEKKDIRFVGIKDGEKVTFARVSRQQILDDWAKIHDALYALCQQPLKVLPYAPTTMPGSKRVQQ